MVNPRDIAGNAEEEEISCHKCAQGSCSRSVEDITQSHVNKRSVVKSDLHILLLLLLLFIYLSI